MNKQYFKEEAKRCIWCQDWIDGNLVRINREEYLHEQCWLKHKDKILHDKLNHMFSK